MAQEIEVIHDKAVEQMNKGVVTRPHVLIPEYIQKKITEELAKEDAKRANGIVFKVGMNTGANLVFAHTTKTGWEVDAYVGTKWSGEIDGGFEILKRW